MAGRRPVNVGRRFRGAGGLRLEAAEKSVELGAARRMALTWRH